QIAHASEEDDGIERLDQTDRRSHAPVSGSEQGIRSRGCPAVETETYVRRSRALAPHLELQRGRDVTQPRVFGANARHPHVDLLRGPHEWPPEGELQVVQDPVTGEQRRFGSLRRNFAELSKARDDKGVPAVGAIEGVRLEPQLAPADQDLLLPQQDG